MRSNSGCGGEVVDDVTAALRADLDRYTTHATTASDSVSGAARVDRIALLEQLRSAVAAAQNAEMVAFGREQVAHQIAQTETGLVDPVALGRGIGDQIALACHTSPFHGSRRLETARALHADLPATAALLAAGRISERVAELVVSQTRHLDGALRRQVDAQVVAAGLEGLSVGRAEAVAKTHAYDADPAGYCARGRTARSDRRVTLRPAPDTMSVLSALLPVEQGVACLAALKAHTDTLVGTGDGRGRGQIMADTLVERVTGQAKATDVDVEVGIVMSLDTLINPEHESESDDRLDTDHDFDRESDDGDADHGLAGGHGREHGSGDGGDPAHTDGLDNGRGSGSVSGADPAPRRAPRPRSGASAEIVGYGPIPAGIARDILATTAGKRWWRRLFTRHKGGPLIDADPRRRLFDGILALLITLRDHGRCRDPFCDAPIRHLDHIDTRRAGGPSSYTNGRGVCARGNYVREMPGWHVEVIDDGLGTSPHTVRTTTPTGHTYTSTAGPAP